jgi:hypothetical protein
MTMNKGPKQLVIDKSLFEATPTRKIKEFARNYFLILPNGLLYECLTTQRAKNSLLHRFREGVLAGGYLCSSIYDIVRYESEHLMPYGTLVNAEYCDGVRQTLAKNADPYNYTWVTNRYRLNHEFIEHFQSNIKIFTKLQSEKTDVIRVLRHEDHSNETRPNRLRYWAKVVDSKDLHNAGNQLLIGFSDCPEKYCLSKEWVSWQFVRVFMIWLMECFFLSQTGGGKGSAKLEHDLHDMGFVALLSRVDALLMRDKLAQDLARVAFPDKDVFSSLDEVPEDYICHWTR